jgi:hypothetical protein
MSESWLMLRQGFARFYLTSAETDFEGSVVACRSYGIIHK